MAEVTVLIPTRDRLEALLATLTSLCFQTYRNFTVLVANQGDRKRLEASLPLQCVRRLFALHGQPIHVADNLPPRGMAQQRQFLLDQTRTAYCLFLDDDILLEPYVLRNLVRIIKREQCGFVGNSLVGLSYINDHRPQEEAVTFWEGPVRPETVAPGSPAWDRYRLHNAANALHVQQRLRISPEEPRTYKVAWVSGCVLYDTAKLRSAGGFSFWHELPRDHSGEDVLAQLKVMKRYGGCGILPTGAYHQELPTTIAAREVDAPEYLVK